DINWPDVERVEGQHDWASVDRVVDFAASRDLRIFGTIAAAPRDASKYVAFVKEVARRYRGRIQALGIWNEPNLEQFWKGAKKANLDEILLPGLCAIKQEAPEILRCGPDLSSSGDYRKDWLEPILRAAGSEFDVITHHQYDGKDTVAGRVKELDSLRSYLQKAGYGEKPFWLTEIGWQVGKKVTADAQAKNLRGILEAMLTRPWWNKTFWYDSHGAGWGLLGSDGAAEEGQPTPSFLAYRDVIQAATATAAAGAAAATEAPEQKKQQGAPAKPGFVDSVGSSADAAGKKPAAATPGAKAP
ncbi:MAG: glycosyl hydrolase, partial [Planctomycetota bacterium]